MHRMNIQRTSTLFLSSPVCVKLLSSFSISLQALSKTTERCCLHPWKSNVIFPTAIQTRLTISIPSPDPSIHTRNSFLPSLIPLRYTQYRVVLLLLHSLIFPLSQCAGLECTFRINYCGLCSFSRLRSLVNMVATTTTRVVKVKRDTLRECMTCPLCNKLLKDATTISLCLHTFCRKCIFEKLSDEEEDCCPVCYIDLGCIPVDKIRPDHNLQDIRSKIFPFKRRKVKAPEILPSVSPPAKRKERSLSSLVVSAPKGPTQTGFTGKRTKTATRNATALRRCSFILEKSIKKEESIQSNDDDDMDSSMAEPSKNHKPSEGTENGVELAEGKVDLWTPLNCLVEAANRTKSSRSNSQAILPCKSESSPTQHNEQDTSKNTKKPETPALVQSEISIRKSKNKDNGDGNSFPSGSVKRRRLHTAGQKRVVASEVFASGQGMLDATGGNCNRKNSPIWFSLVASEDQKGDVPLPQISACYVRIKDGTVPVSFIQKYLVKKLNLVSEAEVEIMCRGQSVLPTLQLYNLVDLWFRTAPTSKKIPASVGSSAKDFVMVLSYCRKSLPP